MIQNTKIHSVANMNYEIETKDWVRACPGLTATIYTLNLDDNFRCYSGHTKLK